MVLSLIFLFIFCLLPLMILVGGAVLINNFLAKKKTKYALTISVVASYLFVFFGLWFLESLESTSHIQISLLGFAYLISFPSGLYIQGFDNDNVINGRVRDALVILTGAFQWGLILWFFQSWKFRKMEGKKGIGEEVFKKVVIFVFVACFWFLVLRLFVFETFNFTALHNSVICGEVKSPDGKYVLTVGNLGMVTNTERTFFYLRRNDEKLKFEKRDLLTGAWIEPQGNVLVLEGGPFFPYGIVWKGSNDLLINLMHPIDWEYTFYGRDLKMYRVRKDQWNDVKISFGLLNERKYPGEIRVFDKTDNVR